MKRFISLCAGFLVLLGGILWIGGFHTSGKQPRVLLIGVDGGSWDMVQRLAAENRVPNLQRLIESGSAGYLSSLAWKKRTGGPAGFYSPIVWATIATGKLPSKHGIEDFKIPIPNSTRFRMGVRENEESTTASLIYPLTSRQGTVIVIRAKAPPRATGSNIQVLFNNRPAGTCEFGEQFSDCRVPIPVELFRYDGNQIDFRFTRVRKIGPNSIALDLESIRIYDMEGKELFDYNQTRNANLFLNGWFHDVPLEFALASSFHLRTRTLWEILSEYRKRIAVVGWWATWPAYEVNGYLVSSHVGLHGARRTRKDNVGFLDTLPALTYPAEFLEEIKPLYTPQEQMVPEFGRFFFEIGKCGCIGSVQERIVLERFWQDTFFSRISKHLLDKSSPFDLFAVYFRGTDTMSHQFAGFSYDPNLADQLCGGKEGCDIPRIKRIVDNYYTFVDHEIGEIVKQAGPNTIVFLVTDHGQVAAGRKGSHENNGFIIVSGPGIRQHTVRSASVLDIAPTVLYAMNLPVAQDMDGRVLNEIFTGDFLSSRHLAYVESFDSKVKSGPGVVTSEELEEQDTEELKALGYIN